MSRENPRNYPRSVESKNSFLRIRAPENLDIALEGLIRKVLKEQPKMDDIYAFAADYFDMLLKIREKAGIRKLSAQDICPYHNEDDAHEMVKLASSFTKRTKPHSNTYKALTLRNPDQGKYKKTSEKLETKDLDVITKENEGSDRFENVLTVVKENAESAKTKNESVESESTENETPYSTKTSGQEIGEEVFIRANEVVAEYNDEDEENEISPKDISEPETVGDINELRDKIKAVENEIKLLDNKQNKGENEVADEEVPGESLEKGTNETGNLNENSEASKLRSVEDGDDETRASLTEETEVKENLIVAKTQEPQEAQPATENTEQSEDINVNEENVDASGKKLEEQQGIKANTENEEEQTPGIEAETKDMESETQDVNEEKEEETKPNTEVVEEEAQDVNTDGVEKLEEAKPNTETVEEETHDVNTDGVEKLEEAKPNTEIVGEETHDVNTDAVEKEEETKPNTALVGEEVRDVNADAVEKEEETKPNTAIVGEEVRDVNTDGIEKEEETKPNTAIVGEEVRDVNTDGIEKLEEARSNKETVEEETHDVNTDAAGKIEETKPNTEIVQEEKESEAEEVKSSGNDSKIIKEMSLEKETEIQEISVENPTEIIGQDEAVQEKEKEIMGEENLKNKKTEEEKFVEQEREALRVQISDVTNTEEIEKEDVTSRDENSEVHDVDAAVPDKTTDADSEAKETEQTEKDVITGAGTYVNVTDSIPPVLLGSNLNAIQKSVEAPVEEPPSAEEILLRDEQKNPEISVATEIEKFLDSEREYSSNAKEAESRHPIAVNDENSVESEIVSRTVSQLGTIKENEELVIPGDDTSEKASGTIKKPDDIEPDNHEGSTTSDEFEFEISPAKDPETGTAVTTKITEDEDDEMHEETKEKPEIILEVDVDDQKGGEQAEEYKREPNKILLEVPELLLDEHLVRKSEDETSERERVGEEPEVEAIPQCSNVGNEIIQKREVEKVELVEGEEDILQVHLTTTIETEHEQGDSVHVEMTSRIDPDFRVSVETRVESPIQDTGNMENVKLIKAAVIIQNRFRRFKNKKLSEEREQDNKKLNNEDASDKKENGSNEHEDSNPPLEKETKRTLDLSERRTVLETQSLDSVRKISPLKTRSLSSVRYGVADFEVWNQLVKELEEAATKIQSNYRGYKTRKKLQRGNAVQSTTTTSEDSTSAPDLEISHRHTGEFHDTLVLPLDPK